MCEGVESPERAANEGRRDNEADHPVHDQQVDDEAGHRQRQRKRHKEDDAGQDDVLDDDVLAEEVDGEHFRYFRSRGVPIAPVRPDYKYIIANHKHFVNSAYDCSVNDRPHI